MDQNPIVFPVPRAKVLIQTTGFLFRFLQIILQQRPVKRRIPLAVEEPDLRIYIGVLQEIKSMRKIQLAKRKK